MPEFFRACAARVTVVLSVCDCSNSLYDGLFDQETMPHTQHKVFSENIPLLRSARYRRSTSPLSLRKMRMLCPSTNRGSRARVHDSPPPIFLRTAHVPLVS